MLCTLCFGAKDAVSDYARLSKLSSDSLLKLGREYYSANNANQAMTCFTIVSERYREGMNDKETDLCLRAINNMGCVFRFFYYDYTQSYESFNRGLAICDEVNNERMRLVLMSNLSELLDEYAARYPSKQMEKQAWEMMDQCIVRGYETKNWGLMATAFFNMTNLNYDAKIEKYRFILSSEIPEDTDNLRYVRLQYFALEAMQQNNYEEARHFFELQLHAIDVKEQPELNILPTYLNIAKTYEREYNLAKAVEYVKQALDMALKDSVPDYEMICYKQLSDYYKQMGDSTLSREFYIKYLEQKEQMQASRLANVGEMNYIQQLKQEELKANKMAARQRRQLLWLIFGSVLLLFVGGSALLLYRKNRQLLFSNQSLFEKNQEVMRAEETEHQLRKEYEEMIHHYHEDQEKLRQLSAEQIELAHENEHETEQSQNPTVLVGSGSAVASSPSSPTPQQPSSTPQQPSPKYSKSNLSDEQRATLIYRIQEVLNTPDIICQTDFSLAKLAKLVGSNTAYVSQVINEKPGQTFNTLVGKYRIKEACRRLNDTKNFGHLTLETISEGVGFKSRTTFVTTFKRLVGLTPSEYAKMANTQ